MIAAVILWVFYWLVVSYRSQMVAVTLVAVGEVAVLVAVALVAVVLVAVVLVAVAAASGGGGAGGSGNADNSINQKFGSAVSSDGLYSLTA